MHQARRCCYSTVLLTQSIPYLRDGSSRVTIPHDLHVSRGLHSPSGRSTHGGLNRLNRNGGSDYHKSMKSNAGAGGAHLLTSNILRQLKVACARPLLLCTPEGLARVWRHQAAMHYLQFAASTMTKTDSSNPNLS